MPCTIDLGSEQAKVRPFVELIRSAEQDFGEKCVAVIIDTLARSMNGADENSTVDMNCLVARCDDIRTATGAAVHVIHHSGKDRTKGARGSGALRAAVDTEIEIEAGRMTVRTQRDMECLPPMRFQLRTIAVGARDDGKAMTSAVVEWIEQAESEFSVQLSGEEASVLDVLVRVCDEKGEAGHEELARESDGSRRLGECLRAKPHPKRKSHFSTGWSGVF